MLDLNSLYEDRRVALGLAEVGDVVTGEQVSIRTSAISCLDEDA
jgi:hypothetical protein